MKNNLYIEAFVIFSVVWSYAQVPDTQWTKIYGGTSSDYGYSVQQTNDGGYIIVGMTESFGFGQTDVWLIKTDSNGDKLWDKIIGGGNWDYGYLVQQTKDGGYIIVGETFSFGNGWSDLWMIKTDSFGDTLWIKIFGGNSGDGGSSVQQSTDGGYIVVGYTAPMNSDYDVWLLKTDIFGDTLWTKTFGGTASDMGSSVQQTIDGGYIIAGETYSYGSGGDIWIIKTDYLGDTLWTKTFGGIDRDWSTSIQQSTDSGYIILGNTISLGAGSFDLWLLKTNNFGDTLWTKTFGGNNWDIGHSVQQTNDGGYIITGYTLSFGLNYDMWLIKTDEAGDTVWTKRFGGSNWDVGYSVQQTNDGGYIITGGTDNYVSADVWLIKTAPDVSNFNQYNELSPLNFSLQQNYPNPFNPTTTIKYSIPGEEWITLKIYDILGKEVTTLVNEEKTAGNYEVQFDGRNIASGVYFYKLQAGDFVATKKIILMK